MSTYWRKKFEHNFITTETKLGLAEIFSDAKDAYLGWLGASLMAFHGEIDPAKLDALDQIFGGESRVRMAANDCYDYAINGRLRLARSGAEQDQMNDAWGSLAILLLSARPGIELFMPEVRGHQTNVPTRLEHLFFHALVRARLDLDINSEFEDNEGIPMILRGETHTEYLTLKEIALLGQMSERAVRNAAQPTAADRLYTRKEQNQTVVDSKEALRWLKGRRGFVVTRAD
ncbi:hypothetical protein [Pseudomonas lundensis]|uniref:hypothetical protein n=1 Tax=Pseudomonas lundensis TaxID=86185 RepID=UPI000BA25608|nr:hypothetical protein [Pseudomonas lundensis]OZY43961.1 hypothetical protein CJF41_22855 [Pseudomonas lundensis]